LQIEQPPQQARQAEQPQQNIQMQRQIEQLQQQLGQLLQNGQTQQQAGQPRPEGEVRDPAAVSMIEAAGAGMLGSALDGMEYADVLQWEGSGPKQADKRKRTVSDGEFVERRPQNKRPAYRPASHGDPGQAIPEEVLEERPSATNPADLVEKKKRRRPKDREPIRMMKGQPTFKTMEALRDTEVKGLTYGQLFHIAPATRQEVSYGLVQERPPRKKKEKAAALVEPVSRPQESGLGHAGPEIAGRIVNFYTTARVTQSGGNHPVCTLKRVLIDGGSVLNMMPLALAEKMHLDLKPQTEVVMRTAASTFHEIKYYVNLDITVAGVTATIRCYCLPGFGVQSSYTLLLGRRWMKQVRALGDYAKDTYHIHDMAGYRYTLEASAAPAAIQKEIPQLCINTINSADSAGYRLDKESFNELKLSRNELCEKLHREIQEQVAEDSDSDDDDEDEDESDDASQGDADSESSEYDEDAENESGNDPRHEVSSLLVAARKEVARLEKMKN
jgi:hypothetical protein